MHIPENVQITIPVESTTTNSFGRTDSEKGVVLVGAQDADGANVGEKTRASKANAVDQYIIGTVGGEGDMAKVSGEIVMQASAEFTDAQMQAGFIATGTDDGKVDLGMPQGLPLAQTEEALSPAKALTIQSALGLPLYSKPCR